VTGARAPQIEQKPPTAAAEQIILQNAQALTTALQQTPAVREDVVRRAMDLLAEPGYPPPETIKKLSNLLAIQMSREG
jgi:hypothetical protein